MWQRRLKFWFVLMLGAACQLDRLLASDASPTSGDAPISASGFLEAPGDVRILPISAAFAEPAQSSGKLSAEKAYSSRLQIPTDLPGADTPQIQLPSIDPHNPAPRQQAIERLFPPLPPVADEFRAQALQGKPLSLADLEAIARMNSPTIRQASADVRAAQGNALQAGLYPNPTIGYESDNINTGRTAGYQGGFFEQVIKTGGKLDLTRASGMIDVENARVALDRAAYDLATSVRTNYFAVLAAEQNVRISHSLVNFSDEIYAIQVDQVKGGQAAAYEPLQLRALAYQARTNLLQARNRYASAWKQLAAALGLPGLPPTELAGKIDAPAPIIAYDVALSATLANHTDVITAMNTLRQAQINLRLAQANRIPDITAHTAVQKDFTTPPFGATVNVAVSAPVPLWDKNQGNIRASEAALAKAMEGSHLTRSNLTAHLADAYERYQNNLSLVDYYRTSILPDQVQTYRGTYARHQEEPDVVGFSDVVAAQQSLTSAISSYVTALGALWQAVVDLANLTQASDLFLMGSPQMLAQIPDLDQLCPLPCRCLPSATDPAQQVDRNWLPQSATSQPAEQILPGVLQER